MTGDHELRLPPADAVPAERGIAATIVMLDALEPGHLGCELAIAAMSSPGFAELHPLVPRDLAQGALAAIRALADRVGERDGWANVSLAFGSAGAARRAIFEFGCERLCRRIVLVASADAATSARASGLAVRVVPAELAAFAAALGDDVAVALLLGSVRADAPSPASVRGPRWGVPDGRRTRRQARRRSRAGRRHRSASRRLHRARHARRIRADGRR